MKRPSLSSRSLMIAGFLSLVSIPAFAEEPAPALPDSGPIFISLSEAVELALIYNYALRQARLDEKDIRAQVSQSWSPVWPRIDGSASYTRNIFAPNPFAGTGAGNAFGGIDATGWLVYRQENPNDQLSFLEYSNRVAEAQQQAGIIIDPDANPFLVENQIQLGLVIKQVLYDGAVFSGLRGSDVAEEIAKVGVDVQALATVRATASAFYGALLAARQTEILTKSVARTQTTVDETKKRVEQGVVPRFQLLTAEVELANLQTQLARARNAAARSIDDLRLVLGLPADRPLTLRGALTLEGIEPDMPRPREALSVAMENRPDLRQAVLTVEAQEIQESATWGNFLPKLNAVANFFYTGSIPDDRSFQTQPDPNDPFTLRRESNDIFSDAYWFSNVNVGLQLEWNFFEGFATSSQLERDRVATMKAKVQLERIRVVVQLEVQQSLRELETARQQIETQDRNRERAELNYEHAQVRVREGVSSQFELRQASEQLDESRFNYLQAVHDFLVARVAYLVAIGTPPAFGSTSK